MAEVETKKNIPSRSPANSKPSSRRSSLQSSSVNTTNTSTTTPSTTTVSQHLGSTLCPYCSIRLTYPIGAVYIQCPSCRLTSQLALMPTMHIPCIQCKTLLAYTSNYIMIQCPKCFLVINTHTSKGASVALSHPTSSQATSLSSSTTPSNAATATASNNSTLVASEVPHQDEKKTKTAEKLPK